MDTFRYRSNNCPSFVHKLLKTRPKNLQSCRFSGLEMVGIVMQVWAASILQKRFTRKRSLDQFRHRPPKIQLRRQEKNKGSPHLNACNALRNVN